MINESALTTTVVENPELPVAYAVAVNEENPFFSAMDRQVVTENGAPAVSTGPNGTAVEAQLQRGDAPYLVFMTDAYGGDTRGKPREIVQTFVKAYFEAITSEEKVRALEIFACYLFNLRGVNREGSEGKGERDLSYWVMVELARYEPGLFSSLLHLFVKEYGSYTDLKGLYKCVGTEDPICELVQRQCVRVFVDALKIDSNSENVSLAGKFTPRFNPLTKKEKKRGKKLTRERELNNKMAREIAILLHSERVNSLHDYSNEKTMNFVFGEYHKLKSVLGSRANVVEKKMSQNDFEGIVPSEVPSCATHKYRKAFYNVDKNGNERSSKPSRRECSKKFKEAVKKTIETGEGIKGTVKGAHGIVAPYVRDKDTCRGIEDDEMLEAMFRNLIHKAKEKSGREGGIPSCVALVDVSGSMDGVPMEVAVALGLVVAEIAPEAWRNRVITFESKPQWHKIQGNTLAERVSNLMSAPWGGSTNFAAALNMILDMAKSNELRSDQLPEILFVFSDMQFDEANGNQSGYGRTHAYREGAVSKSGKKHPFANMQRAFAESGYKMPEIVFWNLRGECTAKPCETICEGAFQMSGYSEAMLEAFMGGKFRDLASRTSTDLMLEVLNDERYDRVRAIVREHFR